MPSAPLRICSARAVQQGGFYHSTARRICQQFTDVFTVTVGGLSLRTVGLPQTAARSRRRDRGCQIGCGMIALRNLPGCRNCARVACRHRLANQRQVREVVQVDSLIEANQPAKFQQSDCRNGRIATRWAIALAGIRRGEHPSLPATRQRSRGDLPETNGERRAGRVWHPKS